MPSIAQIANDVKAILEDIKLCTCDTKSNTAAIKGDTGTMVGQLTQLDVDVKQLNITSQAGFTNLAQGLAVLIQLQAQNNNLLAINNIQNEAIICWLNRIAHVLCDIKRNTDKEILLQQELSATLRHLDDIFELFHAREAMEVANRYALEERLDECCPQEIVRPVPCFEECRSPEIPGYNQIPIDWQPIKYPKG